MGKIVTVYEELVRYVVPLGSPIVIHTPVTDVRTNVDLAAPVAAVRARNSNNAVTQLLRFRDQLKAIKPLLNSSDRSIKTLTSLSLILFSSVILIFSCSIACLASKSAWNC